MDQRLRQFILWLGDACVFYAALFAALLIRSLFHSNFDLFLHHALIFTPVFMGWLLVLYILGLYDFRAMHNFVRFIQDSCLALGFNTLVAIGFFYVMSPYRGITPKTNLLLILLFSHGGLFLWRNLWVRILSARLLVQRVAFLGDNAVIQRMIRDLRRHPNMGYRIALCPMFEWSEGDKSLEYWVPNPGSLPLRLQAGVDLLVVDDDVLSIQPDRFKAIFSSAVISDVPIRRYQDFYETLYRRIPPQNVASPEWLLSHVLPRARLLDAFLKRVTDVVVAFLGLVLLAPLSGAIFAVSMICFRGRPFYSQRRVGYLGREFRIRKFRTMVSGADKAGPLWRIPVQDARVTAWGAVLRRLRLDELPQLWNVLIGEMSLIGPRPEWIEETRVLERAVPCYHFRHLVKPGITGWAQVNFRATNSVSDSLEKLQYDLYYVKNVSFALDVSIFLKTLKRVLIRENAFGQARQGAVREVELAVFS